jgi:SOS response regulatory protein OraA/RecX
MIRIIYIRETKEKGILSLGISEGEEISRYTLDMTFVTEAGLSVGEIDEDSYSRIKARDLYVRGKRKALSLLSFADNSKSALKQKLYRYGIDRETSERIIEEMTSLGYINEDAQLSRMIERLANGQLMGPKKILMRLVSKGYSAGDVKRVMRALTERGEVDFSENKRLLLEKYSVSDGDTEEENRVLYKNGY